MGHGGGITGFVSLITRVPDDEICIILLSNWPTPVLPKIAGDINCIFNGMEPDLPVEKKEISLNLGTLKKYTGNYELTPYFHIYITPAQATGQVDQNGQKLVWNKVK